MSCPENSELYFRIENKKQKNVKKLLILLVVLSIAFVSCDEGTNNATETKKEFIDEHNAENSLDIQGNYVGEFPCDDCPGIILAIALDSNKTYTATTTYKGNESNEFVVTGKWKINKNTISMTEDSTRKVENYFAGENFIQQMDAAGNRMYGENENDFVLRKKTSEAQAIQ